MVVQKNQAIGHSCSYLGQILTNFQNSFTTRIAIKFAIKSPLKIPQKNANSWSAARNQRVVQKMPIIIVSCTLIVLEEFYATDFMLQISRQIDCLTVPSFPFTSVHLLTACCHCCWILNKVYCCLWFAFSCSYQIFSLCWLTVLAVDNSLTLSLPGQTYLFHKHHRLPSGLRTDSTDFLTGTLLLSISFFFRFYFSSSLFLFILVLHGIKD